MISNISDGTRYEEVYSPRRQHDTVTDIKRQAKG